MLAVRLSLPAFEDDLLLGIIDDSLLLVDLVADQDYLEATRR